MQGIRFINHASYILSSGEGAPLLVDPWLSGSAFNGGIDILKNGIRILTSGAKAECKTSAN